MIDCLPLHIQVLRTLAASYSRGQYSVGEARIAGASGETDCRSLRTGFSFISLVAAQRPPAPPAGTDSGPEVIAVPVVAAALLVVIVVVIIGCWIRGLLWNASESNTWVPGGLETCAKLTSTVQRADCPLYSDKGWLRRHKANTSLYNLNQSHLMHRAIKWFTNWICWQKQHTQDCM